MSRYEVARNHRKNIFLTFCLNIGGTGLRVYNLGECGVSPEMGTKTHCEPEVIGLP